MLTKEISERVGSPKELPEHILWVPEGEVFMEVASVVVTVACRTTRYHPMSTHVRTQDRRNISNSRRLPPTTALSYLQRPRLSIHLCRTGRIDSSCLLRDTETDDQSMKVSM